MAYIAPRSLEVSGRVSLGFRLAIDVPIAVRVYYRKMRPNTGPKCWRSSRLLCRRLNLTAVVWCLFIRHSYSAAFA